MASSTTAPVSSTIASWLGTLLCILSFLPNTTSAHSVPKSTSYVPPAESLHFDLLPERNTTGGPAGEIQCYALPYGGMGIFSHTFTFWAMIWIGVGRAPLWPLHCMEKFYKFDLALAIMTVCTCIPVAIVTLVRCWLSWYFVLISLWKLLTSISLACITMHRCIIIRRTIKYTPAPTHPIHVPQTTPRNLKQRVNVVHSMVWNWLSESWVNPYQSQPQPQPQPPLQSHRACLPWFRLERNPDPTDLTPLYWLILHLLGTILGMSGLLSLVTNTLSTSSNVRKLTIAFIVSISVIPLSVFFYWCFNHFEAPRNHTWRNWRNVLPAYTKVLAPPGIVFLAIFGVFSTVYADLVLGALADNWEGLPSQEFAWLYWVWFAGVKICLLCL